MKDILQKLDELDKAIDQRDPAPEITRLDEQANMNISMSGETADEVASLLRIMQGGGAPEAKPVGPDMMPMKKLIKIANPDMDDPEAPSDGDMNDLKPGIQKEPCKVCGKVHLGNSGCGGHESTEEEWDNSPDEEYKDTQYMTKDLSGGANREKGQYKASVRGDNAMAMEELQTELRDQLMAKMNEAKDEEKFDEMGCVKEMKKLYASGCTKAENYKKCKEGYGCSRGQFEKLYASNCG